MGVPAHDFPPYKTLNDYFAKREADGTTQQVHDLSTADEPHPIR
ncbi:hypothetical protein [Streptomyces sp. NPDC051001]